MSYLELPAGFTDFSKLVLSLWFRVPQSTLNTAFASIANDRSPFDGIIPLLTFGPAVKWKPAALHSVTHGSSTYDVQHFINFNFYGGGEKVCQYMSDPGYPIPQPTGGSEWYLTGAEPYNSEPSYIGVDCTNQEQPVLSVNIQMAEEFSVFDGVWMTAWNTILDPKIDWMPPYTTFAPDGTPACALPATDEDNNPVPVRTWNQTNYFKTGAPVLFGGVGERFRGGEMTVVPDHWHHLLLSLDLSNPVNTSGIAIPGPDIPDPRPPGVVHSSCKMWIAYDDRNLTEKTLSRYWPEDNGDPNALLTMNGYEAFHTIRNDAEFNHPPYNDHRGNMVTVINVGYPVASYEFTPGLVKASGNPLGIPASKDYVSRILPVEMAELQLFTGVTLDTGVVENRRAFIDNKGLPVSPVKPEPEVGPAEQLLGKKPDVLLHGSGNWIAGTNTGMAPSGSTDPGTKPGENLTPTGLIINYSPEPSLNGPQSPDEAPATLLGAVA